MRALNLLVSTCVLAALGLQGCGGDDLPAGARVRILTSSEDGTPEGQLKIQAIDDRSRIHDLKPADPKDPAVYYAPGAPPGHYRVLSDAGWGQLWVGKMGASAPQLHGAGLPAAPVRLGKPRTIYLGPTNPQTWQLSDTWAADYRSATDPEASSQPAPLKVTLQADGLVALQFQSAHWVMNNELRVIGKMTSGHVSTLVSYVVRDEQFPDLPRLALVHGAQHAPLAVHLVAPAGSDPVKDGTLVRVHLVDVPFAEPFEAASYKGVAGFDGLPGVSKALRISLPASGADAVFVLDRADWRTQKSFFAVALDGAKARRVSLAPLLEDAGDPVVAAYAHGPGAAAFGRVPLTKGGAGTITTTPGWQEWLLRTASGAWAHGVVHVPAGTAPLAAPKLTLRRGCRIKGSVRGAGKGYHVVCRLVLPAPGEALGGAAFPARRVGGFASSISPTGEYVASLPAGRVEIRVRGPRGSLSRPRQMDLQPGTALRLDLTPN